jgi:CheY-like chemotaxis protein
LFKLKILLVEDNQLNVKLILSLFSENSLKLEVAENGSMGIKIFKENSFDIILMDMEMPVMNGYEAASIIRQELGSNIPIIAMTAHAMAGEKERCLSLGMNDYISKPINANLLFEKIYALTFNS